MATATKPPKPPEIKVIDELQKLGVKATFEYPGFILIVVNNLNYCYGTINDFWTGDINDDDGKSYGGIEMERFPPDHDPAIVANAIKNTLELPLPKGN